MIIPLMEHIERTVMSYMENTYLDAADILQNSEVCLERKRGMYQIQKSHLDKAKNYAKFIIEGSDISPEEKKQLMEDVSKKHEHFSNDLLGYVKN